MKKSKSSAKVAEVEVKAPVVEKPVKEKVRITNLMPDILPLLLKRNGKLIVEHLVAKKSIIVLKEEVLPDAKTKELQKRLKIEYLT